MDSDSYFYVHESVQEWKARGRSKAREEQTIVAFINIHECLSRWVGRNTRQPDLQ